MTASSMKWTGRHRTNHMNIYIDNSNIWIQGQKTYAEKHRMNVDRDPTWRFDVGRLLNVLIRESKDNNEDAWVSKAELYASIPPPVDTVWRRMEEYGVNVHKFSRSRWTGREKEVDAEIIADSVEEMGEAFHGAIPSTFVIVSGDRDIYRAVLKIAKKGFEVHVWSWKNALASVYRDPHEDSLIGELIKVHLLDDYLTEISFSERHFRVDRGRISPDSIVILDPLPKAAEVKETVSSLQIPVYQYSMRRPEETCEDLVIIPVFTMEHNDNVRLLRSIQRRLGVERLKVMTYMNYDQMYLKRRDADPELMISNSFQEFQSIEQFGKNGETDNSMPINASTAPTSVNSNNVAAEDDGFILVDKGKKKQEKRLKRTAEKRGLRCRWRMYCPGQLDCPYGHVPEEEKYFQAFGNKVAKKTRLCRRQECVYGSRCDYAHGEGELFCPTCERVGAHDMAYCPENAREKFGRWSI